MDCVSDILICVPFGLGTLVLTCLQAAKLLVSLDAPSANTGTGGAVVLDGQDAALVRATVVDANGRKMHMAANNVSRSCITFDVQVLLSPGTVVSHTKKQIF